jgi:hypothetical protein
MLTKGQIVALLINAITLLSTFATGARVRRTQETSPWELAYTVRGNC